MSMSSMLKTINFWNWKTKKEYEENTLQYQHVKYIPKYSFNQYWYMHDSTIKCFEEVLEHYEKMNYKIIPIEEYRDPLLNSTKYGGCRILIKRGDIAYETNFHYDDFYILNKLKIKLNFAIKEINIFGAKTLHNSKCIIPKK